MHIKDCCMVNIAAGIFFINDCGMELLLLLEAFTSPYLLGFENLVYCPLWFFFFRFNLCRRRTLVAIGTHDLGTIEGPFTYEV